MYTIDIDIGGTFTDGFFSDGTDIRTRKVLTTPHDITEGFMDCVRAGSEAFDVALETFLHRCAVARVSTTIGTNLLVQRSGPRLGLIVTAGYERTLYGAGEARILGRYIAPDMVRGVPEAVDERGRLIDAVDGAALLEAVRRLVQDGARMVVVSFRNAWRNPANEQRARALTRERYPVHYLRSVPLQIATEVVHVLDDHARTNSAVLNAYVHGEMARRLYRAEDKLRAAGFSQPLLVVHANGGNARVAKTVALNTLHSGPAVAVRGAATMAGLLGLRDIVTTDMGGTSLDVAVIRDGALPVSAISSVDGADLAMPMIEIEAIGAGGGSIARVENGRLRVGPESAGAAPGPACYGKGGMEPTVTDADLLLGLLDPEYFLGGRMRLDAAAARRVTERRVARGLGVGVEVAAWHIREAVNRLIAEEIGRRLAGRNAAEVALFSFGGCGPLHACSVAALLGIPRIVAFPFGSVFSAFGSSTTNVRHTYSRTLALRADQTTTIPQALAGFREQAARDMAAEGMGAAPIRLEATLHVQAAEGARTVPLPVAGAIAVALPAGARMIERLDLVAECEVPHWVPQKRPPSSEIPRTKGERTIYWRRAEAAATPVFDSLALRPGQVIVGPAVLEAPDTAYVVDPGWQLGVDAYGNFLMERHRR